MKQRALITGVGGQDGSYLAEHLIGFGYRVFGITRHATSSESRNLRYITDRSSLEVIEGDVTDHGFMEKLIKSIRPHEVYNLASQSHVAKSFEIPELTNSVTADAVVGILEAIRASGFNSKFYQASTSELFGNAIQSPQTEDTVMIPVSPYGCSKLYAHHITRVYREAYNMFACCGILFNHESPRRGPEFVTQKIALAVAKIMKNPAMSPPLRLGNLDAKRDWGHAKDYVRGMHMMLQHRVPKDFVLATGETHTVREFVETAFKRVGLDWMKHVVIDQSLYRPIDVNVLVGDPSRARDVLGWMPRVTFQELVDEMVDAARKA